MRHLKNDISVQHQGVKYCLQVVREYHMAEDILFALDAMRLQNER